MSKYGNIFEWFLPQNMANFEDLFQTNPLWSPFFGAINKYICIYYWSLHLKFMAQKSLSLQGKVAAWACAARPKFLICLRMWDLMCEEWGRDSGWWWAFREKCCRSPRGRLLYRSIGWRRVVVAVVPWPMGHRALLQLLVKCKKLKTPQPGCGGRHHKSQSWTLHKLFPKRDRVL
jgi:hypothetical protein